MSAPDDVPSPGGKGDKDLSPSRPEGCFAQEVPVPFSLLLAAAIGLSAQVAQLVMFREMLALCRGTELYFGVVLAAGLLWTTLGSLVASVVGRRAARSWPTTWPQTAGRLATGLWFANGLALVGQVAAARLLAGPVELTFLQATATAAVATGPVAFLAGLEFVWLLQSMPRRRFGRLYQVEALGATAGGLLTSFVLVERLDAVTVGPTVTAALGLLLMASSPPGRRRRLLGGVAAAVIALVTVTVVDLDGVLHTRRWAARHSGYELMATEESRYGQLAVLRHPEFAQYSLYIDGALVETLPAPDAEPIDARNEALLAVAQHPAPRRVLLVGGGLARLPEELLRMGIESLDVVEIDPALVRLARRFGGARHADPRLRVHLADGRYFLKRTVQPYDLIVLKAPAPLSALVNRYYTVEFFREARAALAPDGVLMTGVMAAANYPGESVGRLSASIRRTLQQVFGEVLVAPGERHTFFAATRPGIVSLDPQLLARRIADRGIVLPDVDPDFRRILPTYYAARIENLITTSQVDALRETLDAMPAAVNSDARPITYQYALLVWNQITSARADRRDPGLGSGANALFQALLRMTFGQAVAIPVGLAALVAVVWLAVRPWRTRGGPRIYGVTVGLVAAFATGLFGMAGEIVLLLSFQNTYGYAYAEAGVIVAVFMASLAAGAAVGARTRRPAAALVALLTAMIAAAFGLVPLVADLAGTVSLGVLYWVFLALVALVGFLDGATFPPLVELLARIDVERPGGWVYAADLAGAGVGALVVGTVLVPVLGMAAAMGLVGLVLVVPLAALIALWASRRAPRRDAD